MIRCRIFHAEQAVLCDAPKGELTDRMSLPVTVHETFPDQKN